MAWVATAVVVGSTIKGQYDAHKARGAQRKANDLQKQLNELGNKQNIRAFLKNYRQQQANVLASGLAAGLGIESSSVQGAQSSLRTQANLGVTEAEEMTRLGGAAGDLRIKAGEYNMNAQLFGQVASLATSFIPTGPKDPELKEIDIGSLPKKRG
jgi:hypothetical protein